MSDAGTGARPLRARPRQPPSEAPIVRAPAQRFERPLVYFRFTPEEFIVSVAGSDETYRTTPDMAVHRTSGLVVEIGPDAPLYASGVVEVRNGFRADRGIISDMDVAELAFRYAFQVFRARVRGGLPLPLRWMRPDLLIHPLHLDASLLTPLERQGLVDMGLRAGARRAAVYLGPELSDLHLRTGSFVAAR